MFKGTKYKNHLLVTLASLMLGGIFNIEANATETCLDRMNKLYDAVQTARGECNDDDSRENMQEFLDAIYDDVLKPKTEEACNEWETTLCNRCDNKHYQCKEPSARLDCSACPAEKRRKK